MLVVYLAF